MAKKKAAEEGAATEDSPKKKSKKKLLVVPLLVIVLAGGYYYMGKAKKPVASASGGPPTTVKGALVEEQSLTVNLRDNHYLQFTAALQVAPGAPSKILTTDQAVVLDILNAQAGAMTEPQLLAPGGAARLKANIVRALDQEWPGMVSAVYFEQFTMQ
jgi:flagellar basal body-associated protein FliL